MEILLDVDLRAGGGRRRAIEAALRSAIRAGRLAPGTPLPSTRALASELGVARGTVVDAYDQLVAEGFLTARRGGRTVVAAGASRTGGPPAAAAPPPPRVDLSAGAPDLHAFPAQAWARAVRAVLRDRPEALDYAGGRGRPELHAALVDYLARARGVSATPGQVVVCSGVDEALGLVVRALAATGRRRVAMEDPCLSFHRRIVAEAGGTVVPVPVDGDGLDVDALDAVGAEAVVVTPARQPVLGSTLAPERRGALVAWARRTGGVVVEDDYDGELRYDRQPIGALQALDPSRTVYLGTASKSLAPGLRMGWVVVPPELAGAVEPLLPFHSPVSSLDQLVLAELVESHAFDRHLRRMRTAYRRRRDQFVALLAERAPAARVEGVSAGLHALVRWPDDGPDEQAVVAEAAARGIAVTATARMWHRPGSGPPGLLVGYGRPPAHAARSAFEAFAGLMADLTGPAGAAVG
ncbi:MAG TPA: PLP-dependent aminotransferase family protein [Acidimicrobiales bacterium]|nr:PLP-dependent aminotransferase family protein [Acidimicrobiales bacterium]